jgi:hypothetical protein
MWITGTTVRDGAETAGVGAGGRGGSTDSGGSCDDDVVDAEFRSSDVTS